MHRIGDAHELLPGELEHLVRSGQGLRFSNSSQLHRTSSPTHPAPACQSDMTLFPRVTDVRLCLHHPGMRPRCAAADVLERQLDQLGALLLDVSVQPTELPSVRLGLLAHRGIPKLF